MTAPEPLAAWLDRLEQRNREAIVLGLDRVAAVRDRLGLTPAFPVIVVGGTNGKGSVCAYLEAVLIAAGYRVGCYGSPHLLRYNERVRIDGAECPDAELVAALDEVENARLGPGGEIALTYFEQGTLAAMWLFQRARPDVVVLEVGMGGRLDAVNVWDADCAVVASVDLDHQQFLGDTREAIGYEKAGIFRAGRPAICGDPHPPASLLEHAVRLGALVLRIDHEIRYRPDDDGWVCQVADARFPALPRPAMAGAHQFGNAASAIAALWSLRDRLPVSMTALRAGLASARQPGRFQVIGQAPLRVLDVAHNPHAARALAANLADLPPTGRIVAVFAMLADKDVERVVEAVAGRIDFWHLAGLSGARGLPATELAARLARLGLPHACHEDVPTAWMNACRQAEPADTILAFGSFHTVAEVMALHASRLRAAPATNSGFPPTPHHG